jgi:D-2-hydroxyacid dehydrogenase (NADP+)
MGTAFSYPDSHEGVIEAMRDGASALVTFDWDDAFLTPDLHWIQAISAGVNQFPLEDLAESGVILTSARGVHTPAVAEHALALLFAAVRRIGPALRRAERHEWRPEMGKEVRGLTVTILGMGSIGSEIARLLEPFEVTVIGVRRHPEPSDYAEAVVGPEELLWACRRSEVLICALPETQETLSLVGKDELDALGPGWVVNVGRGSSIDEEALVTALTEGALLGAAVDVTATEPLPDHSPLWDIETLTITPHMAWATSQLAPRLVALITENIQAFKGERDWLNRIV